MAGSGTAHLRANRTDSAAEAADIVLTVENMVVNFPIGRGGVVHAVSDVSFDLAAGETLGIVGESGCGKSTTAKAVIQLPKPTSGKIMFDNNDLASLSGEELRRVRPDLQLIFQDPISSLNPRRTVNEIISEGTRIWGGRGEFSQARIIEIMESVGIDPRFGERKPHQFSGGQCQRISIARALVLDPKVLICDEPVSALDVSVQAQILNLLEDMKSRYGLTMMFISHDLSVVKNISDRVMVMYLGKTCEIAGSDDLYANPTHPYTRALMSAIPGTTAEIEEELIEGELPSAITPPPGCRFNTRCPFATDVCRTDEPQMRQVADDHFVACHHPVLDGLPETPVTVS